VPKDFTIVDELEGLCVSQRQRKYCKLRLKRESRNFRFRNGSSKIGAESETYACLVLVLTPVTI